MIYGSNVDWLIYSRMDVRWLKFRPLSGKLPSSGLTIVMAHEIPLPKSGLKFRVLQRLFLLHDSCRSWNRKMWLLIHASLITHLLFFPTGNHSFIKVIPNPRIANIVSTDLLSIPGRFQAFNLGEAFAEKYGFTLKNNSHTYKIEFGGTPPKPSVDKINTASRRLRDGLRTDSGESMRLITSRLRESLKLLVPSTHQVLIS